MIKYVIAFLLIASPCIAGMGIGGFPQPGPGTGVLMSSALSYKVNFQLISTVTPNGYLADIGLSYDAGRGYGWTYSNGNPADFSGSVRERSVNPDKRYDTLIQMAPPNIWRFDVPNGTYTIKVVVGDAGYALTGQYVQVEGVTFQYNVSLSANNYSEITHDVTVSDGTISMEVTGATQSKINFIEITQ